MNIFRLFEETLLDDTFFQECLKGGIIRKGKRLSSEPFCNVCGKVFGRRKKRFIGSITLCYSCHRTISRMAVKIVLLRNLGGRCADCGWIPKIGNLHLLEFHHSRDTKEKNLSRMMGRLSLRRVIKEASKCEVLCRRCHSRRHAKGNRSDTEEYRDAYISTILPLGSEICRINDHYWIKAFKQIVSPSTECPHARETSSNKK